MIEPARANFPSAPTPPPDLFGIARTHPRAIAASHATRGTPWGRRPTEYRHHAARSAASTPSPLRAKKNALTGVWSLHRNHCHGG